MRAAMVDALSSPLNLLLKWVSISARDDRLAGMAVI